MVRLLVLGLLRQRPMHGYEIQQVAQLSKTDQWAGVLPGSIYHALKKMESEGLVAVQSVESTGHRSRAIYEITEAGQGEYLQLLRKAWSTPPNTLPGDLYSALSFMADLPRDELLSAITEQIRVLEERLRDWDAGLEDKGKIAPLPEYLKAAFRNGREHIEADIRFLQHVYSEVQTMPANWAQRLTMPE